MGLLDNLKQESGRLSDLKDPFSNKYMTDFDIYCDNDLIFKKGWNYRGRICYKNGNTKGEQSFEAESLSALLRKMEKFVEELK